MTGQGQPPVEHSLSPLALLIEAGRDQGRRRVVVVSRPVPRQRVQKLRAWRETARDKWRSEKRFFYSCESWRRRTMETSFLDSAAPSFECQRPTNEEKKTWALPSGHPQRNGRGTARHGGPWPMLPCFRCCLTLVRARAVGCQWKLLSGWKCLARVDSDGHRSV